MSAEVAFGSRSYAPTPLHNKLTKRRLTSHTPSSPASTETPAATADNAAEKPAKGPDVNGQGIIVVRWDSSDYASTTTLTLTAINPQNGAETLIRTFKPSAGQAATIDFQQSRTLVSRQYFDAEYRRLTASMTNEKDGSTHVGWIDESGEFFDVTEATTEKQTGFSAVAVKHESGLFFENYYYYLDKTDTADGYAKVLRVPFDRPTQDAVEVVFDRFYKENRLGYIQPDGTPEASSFLSTIGYFYMSDASGSNVAYENTPVDWISATSYLDTRIQICATIPTSDAKGTADKEGTKLIPEAKERSNSNPILSPDKKQVAFLSQKTAVNINRKCPKAN